MRTIIAGLLATVVAGSAIAQDAPRFFKQSLPEHAIGPMLRGYGAYLGQDATLDAKTRELIALAVSAQIPCEYCVYAHRNSAIKLGASEAELREAVAMAGYVRMWSTAFHGAQLDLQAFKTEHDALRAAND